MIEEIRRLGGEVGPSGVADEEGVPGQRQPRLVAALTVDHLEAAMLGPVARSVEDADRDASELELGPVRLPLTNPAADQLKTLSAELDALGFFDWIR